MPWRKACDMALGTSASAKTTKARFSVTLARLFLFLGDGFGTTAFGFGTSDARVGFGLVGLQAGTDVLSNIDVGDINRDDLKCGVRIQPRAKTALEIRSGFSKTSWWCSEAPMDEMILSPTAPAMTVSSVAPPMSCSKLVRTVTRAISATPRRLWRSR